LVIAFFIIPPAAAYLLTDNLRRMLVYSSLIGAVGAYFGYDLARGSLFGLIQVDKVLAGLNRTLNLNLPDTWNSSISASMVLMIFLLFCLAWIFSPNYGLISNRFRRRTQRQGFEIQVVLAHIFNHQDTVSESEELVGDMLYQHFHWSQRKMQRVISRLQAQNLIYIKGDLVLLTARGKNHVQDFRDTQLARETVIP
jgi:manganese/zinc/iron transport system permease protein